MSNSLKLLRSQLIEREADNRFSLFELKRTHACSVEGENKEREVQIALSLVLISHCVFLF